MTDDLTEQARQVIAWDDGKGYPPAPSQCARIAAAYIALLDRVAEAQAALTATD